MSAVGVLPVLVLGGPSVSLGSSRTGSIGSLVDAGVPSKLDPESSDPYAAGSGT